MATTFEVLAEPRRREILDLLRAGERPVGQLVAHLTLSQPTVSKHLKVLREAGLVEVRQDAQRRWYRLRLEPLVELDAWLEPYRELWTAHLDALERHLDAMPDEEPEGDRRATPDEAAEPQPGTDGDEAPATDSRKDG
jgi:DNA-binding transcriptional ArsR family regulator